MSELVFIYAIGGDSELRSACGELLEQNVVTHVGLMNASRMTLKKGNPKVGFDGRAMVIVAEKDKIETVFNSLRSHCDEDLKAWAVPVVASM